MAYLGSRIKQLSNAYECEANHMLQRHGLTTAQAEILRLVMLSRSQGESLNQKDIETALRLKNPTVTGTLNRLEAKGLIRRESDPRDGRRKLIRPTEKALAAHVEVGRAFLLWEQRLLTGIGPREQEQLLGLLDRVLENIQEMREDEDE